MNTNKLTVAEQSVLNYQELFKKVSKVVNIAVNLADLEILKNAGYKLCFAKKVGNNEYTVVWQSYSNYLFSNKFSWVPLYELFGSNTFTENVKVEVSTNVQQIRLGETSTLNKNGILENPITNGPETSFTMVNDYGSIHPGVNQLSTGIDGKTISTPIYVAPKPIVIGEDELKPVEKVLVWFEQNIQTSTMFSKSRSKSIEIDLTNTNESSYIYKDQKWQKV